MTESDDRSEAVRDLIACRMPLRRSIARVIEFPWDSEVELARLGMSDVVAVLRRYVAGELSAREVEDWAFALEGRDDVAYASPNLAEVLFQLSTPECEGPITPALAAELIANYDQPSRE